MDHDWTKAEAVKIERRTRTVIKTLGGLCPCSSIDGIVLRPTEVNLIEKGKNNEGNSKINFLIERKRFEDKFFNASLITKIVSVNEQNM